MKHLTTTKPFITGPGKAALLIATRDNYQRHPSPITILLLLLCACFSFTASAVEKIYYYHNDHLGSPVAMSDQSGTVVWRADYQPFGETATTGSIANTHGYIGKEIDPETGLYYVGARYYDSNTGRFLSRDPALIIGDGGNLNLHNPETLNHYPYSKNNPYRYKDSNGQWFAAAVAGAAALWGYFEMGSTLYDIGNWGYTQFFNPNATEKDKDWASVEVVIGLGAIGPGSAYDDIGEKVIGYVPVHDFFKYADEGINLHVNYDLASEMLSDSFLRKFRADTPRLYTNIEMAGAHVEMTEHIYEQFTESMLKYPGLLRAEIPVQEFNRLIKPHQVGPGTYELCTNAACGLFNEYMNLFYK